MQNSTDIFQMALGLSDPWYTSSVRFEETKSGKELHIDISFKTGSRFLGDDGNSYTAHDTVERSWQHLNFFEHTCFLHARVPRIRYDGKTRNVETPWARKGSGFTLLFEAFSMLLIENEMPVSKAASVVGVYPQRLWNIFSYWIERAHNYDTIDNLSEIGFDETSSKKGHAYVTTLVDMKERRVLFATPGKDSDCIKKSVDYLHDKSVDTALIKHACIDMSPAFISGCNKYLPHTSITFDKFHVVKEVHKAMDELRKQERKGNNFLKGHKYTFLKNRISEALFEQREMLLEYYPKLGEGYRLLQLFKEFWNIQNPEEAEGYLAFWCDMVEESDISSFLGVVKTIKAHWSGIMNYITSRITNGILEGINSKIQLMKKRARGYRKIENYINMIYFTCGKLKFDYPLYST